ncbi:NosD domain-containing protein [Haladaptatus pallidirubidus]|uniref:Probable pectate lyase C n=1 Tax=Haladaptatus pallidirubidus TaxID=1008152 RepID=A0AAV3ULL1_9EURY|nr:NosD domain-containing protein [Haladaptatus pallidirubidus]
MASSRVLAVGLVALCLLGGVADARPLVSSLEPSSTDSSPTDVSLTEFSLADASLDRTQPSRIGSCTKITESGHYVLGQDIKNGKTRISTGCIDIRADHVVLDGRGHLLDGFGVSDTSGVLVDDASNVTVRNLHVKDWNRGITVRNAENVAVRNVTASNNAIGIDVTDSDARLVENTVHGDLKGLVLTDPWDDELERNDISDNHVVNVYAPLAVVDVFGVRLTLGPPLDPDRDGQYEDVTGSGDTGVWDIVALPAVVVADAIGLANVQAEQRNALDFDGDGNLDHGDLLAYAGLTPPA